MMTSFLVLADTGLTWTAETYYVLAAVVQLVVILLAFRGMNLPAEYNTFPHAAMVVIGTNAVGYFSKDIGLVGILLTGFVSFLLLVAVARGDVIKSLVAWALVMTVFWATAYFVVEYEEALISDQLGGIPHMLIEGDLEPEPMTDETYDEIRGTGGED